MYVGNYIHTGAEANNGTLDGSTDLGASREDVVSWLAMRKTPVFLKIPQMVYCTCIHTYIHAQPP